MLTSYTEFTERLLSECLQFCFEMNKLLIRCLVKGRLSIVQLLMLCTGKGSHTPFRLLEQSSLTGD